MLKTNCSIPFKKNFVIGGGSFIGHHLIHYYNQHRDDLFFTDHKSQNPQRRFDLLSPDFAILPLDKDYAYGIIAAAMPNIASCEKNKETSYKCNVETPLKLGKILVEHEITPIFFSSDYVFSQPDELHTEISPLYPITEYGRQKAELERKIPEVCGSQYLLLRLSKVYGKTPGDNTLFDEMFQTLLKGDNILAAYDQIFSPIDIEDVVATIFFAQNQGLTGLFNLCGSETWSRYELAFKVVSSLNFDPIRIQKISLDDLNLEFTRSKYTAMSSEKLCNALSYHMHSTSQAIQVLKNHYSIEEKGSG